MFNNSNTFLVSYSRCPISENVFTLRLLLIINARYIDIHRLIVRFRRIDDRELKFWWLCVVVFVLFVSNYKFVSLLSSKRHILNNKIVHFAKVLHHFCSLFLQKLHEQKCCFGGTSTTTDNVNTWLNRGFGLYRRKSSVQLFHRTPAAAPTHISKTPAAFCQHPAAVPPRIAPAIPQPAASRSLAQHTCPAWR